MRIAITRNAIDNDSPFCAISRPGLIAPDKAISAAHGRDRGVAFHSATNVMLLRSILWTWPMQVAMRMTLNNLPNRQRGPEK
jgi:hypothetical protein